MNTNTHAGGGGGNCMPDADLKLIAMQLATLLPKDKGDAMLVQSYLNELVQEYLFPETDKN